MAHPLRIVGSFAAVLGVFLTYWGLVVPWIEPTARLAPVASYTHRARAGDEARLAPLRELFPANAWELQNPKILEGDQFKLLFGDYHTLDDNRVEIRPCTMILLPGPEAGDEFARHRQAVVMEAPAGAVLQFDRPFNLSRANIGKFERGAIRGWISIHRQGRLPGVEDDLLITTRDVQMTEREVWTPNAVTFQWGRNEGSGSEMHIKLKQGRGGNNAGPNIDGVEMFEITHIDQLHLEMGEAGKAVFGGGNPLGGAAAMQDPAVRPAAEPPLPIEVTCQGPFRCDLIQQVATFEDHVNVWQVHPVGPRDHLSCQLLSIFFGPRDEALAANEPLNSSNTRNRTVKRLEATGYPVVLSAPSEQAYAQGQILAYDVATGRIQLGADQQALQQLARRLAGGPPEAPPQGSLGNEVMLQQKTNEIHTRALDYQVLDGNRLGPLTAIGPGWLRATELGAARPAPSGDEQPFKVQWNDALQVEVKGDNRVISLSGGASLALGTRGMLSAGEIFCRLVPDPVHATAQAASPLRPDRMIARRAVRLETPQLAGTFENMELWFEQAAATRAATTAPSAAGPNALFAANAAGLARQDRGARSPLGPPGLDGAANLGSPGANFAVQGRSLQARVVVPDAGEAELTNLIITGDNRQDDPAQRGDATQNAGFMPARFSGRGMVISGGNINLDRAANRLWIDGPGQLDLPLDRDLENQPLPRPDTMSVTWQQGLSFDGRTATFNRRVEAVSTNQRLRTETLDVMFQPPIRFDQPNQPANVEVEQLLCRGGVSIESRTLTDQQMTRFDRMEVSDIGINRLSGAMNAGGPGTLISVMQGGQDFFGGDGRSPLATRAAPPANVGDRSESDRAEPPPLTCLHVRFRGSMSGNVLTRSVRFQDQVRLAYDTVDNWSATLAVDDPALLNPKGVVGSCDTLTVDQMSIPLVAKPSIELAAEGNVIVESQQFLARGLHATYAQGKDLLVLRGDGRTDAEIFRQQVVGGERSRLAGPEITYRFSTNEVNANAHVLELGRLSN